MQDTTNQVVDLLRDFAAQIGVTTAQVYEVLTKRAYVEGVAYVVLESIIFLVTCTVGAKLIHSGSTAEKADYYGGQKMTDEAAFKVIGGIIALILAILTTSVIPSSVVQMLTPEATAVEQLLRVVKR